MIEIKEDVPHLLHPDEAYILGEMLLYATKNHPAYCCIVERQKCHPTDWADIGSPYKWLPYQVNIVQAVNKRVVIALYWNQEVNRVVEESV